MALAETAPDGFRTVLAAEGLVKRFGDVLAVDGLSLSVRAGEVFGLLGPNGAGKSTAINLVCGLLRPDAGVIRLFGRPVRFGDRASRAAVGVCPQELVLWTKLTCAEQLGFMAAMYGVPRAAARERSRTLLRDLGLYEKRHKTASTLSGGMQRRLNLMLALVHDPDLVVLDEPEAGLDPQSRVLVREYIRSLARRKTVIFTTHNMDEAERVCDRVAILDRGRLLRLDTPEKLKRTVGDGAVLEILAGEGGDFEAAAASLRGLGLEVASAGPVLVVRGRGMEAAVPGVMERLKACGVPALEVKWRQNTLEDVFIELTGRRLRE